MGDKGDAFCEVSLAFVEIAKIVKNKAAAVWRDLGVLAIDSPATLPC